MLIKYMDNCVRLAKLEDVDDIYKIGKNNLPIYYNRREITKEILNEKTVFLVSFTKSNKITGYCFAKKRNDIRIHILSFAVDNKFRRKQFGSKIIDYLVNLSIEKDIKLISLFVKETNNIAREFYSKCGFENKKTIMDYYGTEDHGLVYIKNLIKE